MTENEGKVPEEDMNRYRSQLVMMKKICIEFEAQNSGNEEEEKARFQKILEMMEKVRKLQILVKIAIIYWSNLLQ